MSPNASAEATIRTPYSPMPRPHARAIPVRSASCRAERTGDPGRQRRQSEPADVRDSHRGRAGRTPTMPIAKSTTVHAAERDDRRPVGDAGDRSVAGRPDEERQRLERLDDRRQRGVAVDEVAGEQDDEPERQRPRAPEQRRGRERDATRGQHHHAVQGHLAERGRERDLVTRQAARTAGPTHQIVEASRTPSRR